MKLKIDICQSQGISKKNDLNVISCIDWFEGGEQAVYLLDENGKYLWQAIPRNTAKISCQQQGRYTLHVEKIPPIVFIKPITEENNEQLLAIAEVMFSQYQEVSELPVVNADGIIVAVARMNHPRENENFKWEKLKTDGAVLPEGNIFVSSLSNPHLEAFFNTFEYTGKVFLLSKDNVDDVLSKKIPGLIVYEQTILEDDIDKVNVSDLYAKLYSTKKVRDVAVCGNGSYMRITADNIKKHCPNFRVLEEIDIGNGRLDDNRIRQLSSGGVQGCVPACHTKAGYDQLIKDLTTANMPVVNLYEGRKILSCKDHACRQYLINEGHYPVYVMSDVYGIPNLTFKPRWTLVVYDVNGNLYDFSLSYLLPEVPSIWNCLEPLGKRDEDVEIDIACYVCESISDNYWHFTFQVMNRLFAMEETGFSGKYIVCDIPHIKELVKFLGIPDERLVCLQMNANIKYKIHELHYVKFYENAREGTSDGIEVMQRYAMNIIQRNVVGVDISHYPKRIYVKRIGKRKLSGVDKILKEFGFYTVIPEEHTILEEILYFYAADVVLIPHGAGTANSLYMHEGSTLIETFSRGYVNPCCSSYLLTLGNQVKYRMIVSRGTARQAPNDDYSIPSELLRLTLMEVCGSK